MALPPDAYKQWQDAAPEFLYIDVLSIEQRMIRERVSEPEPVIRYEVVIKVRAQVVAVQRTASGLSPGAEILIEYSHRPPLCHRMAPDGQWVEERIVGAAPLPILPCGAMTPAYLERTPAGTYSPVAGGESFSEPAG